MNNYYIPSFEELKKGDAIQVLTSYGWVEMTYPKITETMFFRRVSEIGFEKAVRRLINMKSIQKFRINTPIPLEPILAEIEHINDLGKSG